MTAAVVGQRVARLPFPEADGGASPTSRLQFSPITASEAALLLSSEHYLGPLDACLYGIGGWVDDTLVAAQLYRWPTARGIPADGTWLELSRWCLTPDAGPNAGSRMMGWAARWLRTNAAGVVSLVSYSDPSHGHDGALYKASGWTWAPTHHRLAQLDGHPYPTGNGSWDGRTRQEPKDRWFYDLRRSRRRRGRRMTKARVLARAFDDYSGGNGSMHEPTTIGGTPTIMAGPR